MTVDATTGDTTDTTDATDATTAEESKKSWLSDGREERDKVEFGLYSSIVHTIYYTIPYHTIPCTGIDKGGIEEIEESKNRRIERIVQFSASYTDGPGVW